MPTELVVTFLTVRQLMTAAVHSYAAGVKFDWILALWALLRVRLDPQIVLVVVLFLFEPHFHLLAVSRVVLFLRALGAE